MTGKTHLSFALALSLVALHPQTPGALFGVIAGAAVGGVLADIDAGGTVGGRERRVISLTALGVAAAAFAADAATGRALIHAVSEGFDVVSFIALALFLALSLIGAWSPHRSFMHSLLALGLLSGAVAVAAPPLGPAFAVGYASHLLLDLTNKKGLPLLFPLRRRWSLRWFKSDGLADKLMFGLFSLSAAALIALSLLQASSMR